MIRDALRRVLWLVPTLAVITIFSFWLVAGSVGLVQDDDADLPLFVNADPKGVHDRAIEAAERVAASRPDADKAAEILARIGGAGLPHVLPHLDSLPPEGRIRVALALSPIARRMKIGKREEYAHRETAVLFWTRFWQDHAIDFRPMVVKRAVRRAVEHPSALRRTEVLAFDTFALGELMDAMASMSTDKDRSQLAGLTALAAAITGNSWTLPDRASRTEVRAIVEKWQRWWASERKWFVPFQGVPRLTAMIRETRYGRWAGQLSRGGFGELDETRRVADVLVASARVTLELVFSGLLGGYIAGTLLGAIAAVRRRETDLLLSALAVVASAVPSTAFAWWASGATGSWAAPALMAVFSAALVFFHQRAALYDEAGRDWVRTERAYGIPPHRSFLRMLRASAVPVVSRAGVDLPLLLTAAFVVERAFSLQGLGATTLSAVQAGNVAWLMALALSAALLVGLLQILSDLALRFLDPRMHAAAGDHRGFIR